MEIDRPALKKSARASVKAAEPSAKLVTLVYILLTGGVSTVVGIFIANPLNHMAELLEQGIDPYYVLEYMVSGGGLTRFVFVSVLLSLYATVMEVGYIGYAMRVARGGSGGYGDLLGGFSFAGKIIGLTVMIGIYALLWSVVVTVPITVIAVVSIGALEEPLLGGVLYAIAVVIVLILMLRYAMAFFALTDDPSIGVFGAIRKSKELMRGNKVKYVALLLSFLGWILLTFVLSAIGSAVGLALNSVVLVSILSLALALPLEVWLAPYMMCAQVNFYDALQGGAPEAGQQPPIQPDDMEKPKDSNYRDDPWES